MLYYIHKRMQVTRLLLLIKISLLAFVTSACSNPWIMPPYDGNIKVYVETPQQIQESWEKFSNQKTRVKGWARWFEVDGKKYCYIHVPPLNSMDAASTWRHEIRHCIEGHWHNEDFGPTVYVN